MAVNHLVNSSLAVYISCRALYLQISLQICISAYLHCKGIPLPPSPPPQVIYPLLIFSLVFAPFLKCVQVLTVFSFILPQKDFLFRYIFHNSDPYFIHPAIPGNSSKAPHLKFFYMCLIAFIHSLPIGQMHVLWIFPINSSCIFFVVFDLNVSLRVISLSSLFVF